MSKKKRIDRDEKPIKKKIVSDEKLQKSTMFLMQREVWERWSHRRFIPTGLRL